MSDRGKLLRISIGVVNWCVTGGVPLVLTGIGIVRHWSPTALGFIGLGTFLLLLAWFVSFREKALAEQVDPSLPSTVTTNRITPTLLTMSFGVPNGETLEIGSSYYWGPIVAARMILPSRSKKEIRRRDLPVRLRVGWVAMWPRYVWVKDFTSHGLLVEGVRSTGVDLRFELWLDED